MGKAVSQRSIDWVAIAVRWIILVGVSLGLDINSDFAWPILFTLSLGILTNIAYTVWLIIKPSTPAYRVMNVLSDMLVAYLLFFFLNGSAGLNQAWIGLLPLISASLYFQWWGAILLALITAIIQGWLAYLTVPINDALIVVAIVFPLYLGVGLLVAYLIHRWGENMAAPKTVNFADHERRQTIYKLISALSATLNYQKVLETALDLSNNTLAKLNAPSGNLISAALLYAEDGGGNHGLKVETSRRWLSVDTDVTLPGIEGLIGHTIDEGRPSLSKGIRNDVELGHLATMQVCNSAYCIPLRAGLDTYGVLLFAHPELNFFTADRREVLDLVGNQSMIALENAKLYQDLEQEKERMMEIQEEARIKMSRDLHDGPTQSVAAIAMRVNFARRLMERDPKAASDELFNIESLARRTTKEIRHMLFTLRPLVLESQGLVAALGSMAEKMDETYGQNVIIQADERVVKSLEAGKQAVVFYIAEEAVNNARKHAQANHIWVRLKLLRVELCMLEIEDDGTGFNLRTVDSSYESRGSLGMVNMRERTELINGILHIDSEVGRGTRIQVVVPLTEEAADRLRRGR